MNKNVIILSIIVLSITIIFLWNSSYNGKVCFKKNCFNVEIVKSSSDLQKGLMFRQVLEKDSGMLFVFPEESIHPFWMKNTSIPLDIIWINSSKNVVYISKNSQPCLDSCKFIMPDKDAKYVLEINFGITDEIRLKIGDKLEF